MSELLTDAELEVMSESTSPNLYSLKLAATELRARRAAESATRPSVNEEPGLPQAALHEAHMTACAIAGHVDRNEDEATFEDTRAFAYRYIVGLLRFLMPPRPSVEGPGGERPRGFVMCAYETAIVPYRHTCEPGTGWLAFGPLGWVGQGDTAEAAFDMCETFARRLVAWLREGKDLGSMRVRAEWTALALDMGVWRLIASEVSAP